MVVIIHGEDTARSRGLLTTFQKKLNLKNKIELDILACTTQDISNALNTTDLFGEFPLVIVDVTNAGRKNLEEHLTIIKKASKKTNIVIYSGKALSTANIFIKNIKDLDAKIIESNAFKFADAVFSKNRTLAYKELERLVLDDVDPIYEIFPALVWKLRMVSYAIFNSAEFEKQKPYVKQNAEQLAKNYTQEEIKVIYKVFYELDKKAKTGEMDKNSLVTHAIETIL